MCANILRIFLEIYDVELRITATLGNELSAMTPLESLLIIFLPILAHIRTHSAAYCGATVL
jgi:hypothetical protein